MPDDHASGSDLASLRRRVCVLEAAVARLARRRDDRDPRLGDLLRRIHAFAHETPWTAGELLRDAGRDDRALWAHLDGICGPRGDPAIRLGLWLARHDGAEVDGYVLRRVRQEQGCWLYAVALIAVDE